MKVNENKAERIIRVIVGLFILSLVFWGPKSLWGLLGLIPLITGLTGIFPLYSLFGFSTCKVEKADSGLNREAKSV